MAQIQLAAGDYVVAQVETSSFNRSTLGIAHQEQTSPEFSMTWLAPGK